MFFPIGLIGLIGLISPIGPIALGVLRDSPIGLIGLIGLISPIGLIMGLRRQGGRPLGRLLRGLPPIRLSAVDRTCKPSH